MHIDVKLFAQARERVGSAHAKLELPAGSRYSEEANSSKPGKKKPEL